MSLKRIKLSAALLCLVLPSAMAQFTSSIQGIVTDESGAAVPEAVVNVTNIESGVSRQANTSTEGLYRVINLGPGNYRVNVVVPGFAPAARPNVPLGISETLRADFTLKVGQTADQVT